MLPLLRPINPLTLLDELATIFVDLQSLLFDGPILSQSRLTEPLHAERRRLLVVQLIPSGRRQHLLKITVVTSTTCAIRSWLNVCRRFTPSLENLCRLQATRIEVDCAHAAADGE